MRRPNGMGTIEKMGGTRRNPYAVRVPYTDRYGHIRQQYLSYHRTPAEAMAALDKYNTDKALGAAPAADKLSSRVCDVYEIWSSRKYAKAGDTSARNYRAAWARMASLHSLKIREVTIDDLQAVIDADEAAGLSASSLNIDKILMRALFKCAMERDIIVKDYSAFIQLPSVGAKYEKGAFTDLQMKKLEQMAAAGVPWADTTLMLCYTGFRITEFLTLTRFSYHAGGDYLQGGMKTAAGKDRVVPVHPKIKPYLIKWLAHGGDTIICDEDGKPIPSDKYRRTLFPEIVSALGLPQATPHWCRHTFATRLHTVDAPELDIKRLLGHANKDVTAHYTHTDIAQLTASIRRLA